MTYKVNKNGLVLTEKEVEEIIAKNDAYLLSPTKEVDLNLDLYFGILATNARFQEIKDKYN